MLTKRLCVHRNALSDELGTVARIIALLGLLFVLTAPLAHAAANPGDPLFCQPQEGTTYIITNSGSDVFTADPDCYNNNPNNDTDLSITTSQGGSLAGTRTPSGINYIYTPPSPNFTGLDTFTIHVTTCWNSAGGTGSSGGSARPGGPTDLVVTLNVLPTTKALSAGFDPVPITPFGSVSGCGAQGNAGHGPPPSAVPGCVTGAILGSVHPAHGTIVGNGTTFKYQATPGYTGPDTFTIVPVGVNTDGQTALSTLSEVTVHVTAANPVPTLGEWGMIFLGCLLIGYAIYRLRRRGITASAA